MAERGGITLTEPEAVISTAADRAHVEILTPEIDTIVWEEVAARALGRAKSGAVVGVLVSITTIPAASNVGVALARGRRR